MDDASKFEIGSDVRCTNADCGELTQVVIDPVARKLTHLVVDPPLGDPRLVPVSLARPTGSGIQLSCTESAFQALEVAVETHFLPAEGQDLGYAHDRMISWPFFGLGACGPGLGLAATEPVMAPAIEIEDRIPAGEVTIRRGQCVHASDGEIGKVRGLVVDPADDSVTHVLLDEGHLWGRKQVAIPIGAASVTEGGEVAVRLDKEQIKALPPVDLEP